MAEFERHPIDLREGINAPVTTGEVVEFSHESTVHSSGSSLTPKIASRLEVFQHIVKEVSSQEDNIAANDRRAYGRINDKGEITEKYFDMDNRFLYIWNQVAFNLYQELEKNPEAKKAALETLAELKKDDVKPMTPGQLVELFNRE